MSYQFIHVGSYSRSTPKKQNKNKDSKQNVRSIVAEANREPGSHPHVENPSPPVLLYGDPVDQIEAKCEAWAEATTDAKGRKARKDALCLLGGVFSMPRDETSPEDWEKIKADAIEWLKEKYGDRLETVIEHTDEAQLHCHFYVIPRPGERFDAIHEGQRAANELKELTRKEQNNAYRAAMRNFQNEYFDAVGAKNGMARIGPGGRRLSRSEWVKEKVQAESIGRKFQQAEELLHQASDTLEASKTTVDALKSSALAEIREMQETARKAADKALEQAKQKGIELGQADALDQFSKSSIWAKLTGLLSRKDAEIAELKTERSTLKKELKAAKKQGSTWMQKAKEYMGLNTEKSEKFKVIKGLVAELRGERDTAVRQRDQALETVKVLRERDEDHAELSADRDLQRARADAAERKLARYEAPAQEQAEGYGKTRNMAKNGEDLTIK